MRMKRQWRPWQKWAVVFGLLGFVGLFADPKNDYMNTGIDTPFRMGLAVGSVVGGMLLGALFSALFSFMGRVWRRSETEHNESAANQNAEFDSIDVPKWRGLLGSWWFSASTLLLVAVMLPLAFQSSPAEKSSKIMATLRFSPFTGLAFRELPSLAAEAESVLSKMLAKEISEQEGWAILGPKMVSARHNTLNPAFRKASDASIRAVLVSSLAALRLMSKAGVGRCRQFAENPVFSPDELSESERAQIVDYGDKLREAYEDGKRSFADQPVATPEEYSLLLQQNGYPSETLAAVFSSDEGACDFALSMTKNLLALPPEDQARFQRLLLTIE